MNTTFVIDGGAGRLVTAIPALEKFAINNPDDDFKVLTAAWENLYWSHPLLQNRTFNMNAKGVFDNFIKNNKLLSPEPYHSYGYYNQTKHLIEAFDEKINFTEDHSDLDKPNLYISDREDNSVKFIINDLKQKHKKDKVLVFQPYGSGMKIENGKPFDSSYRSLDVDIALKLIYNLSKDFLVLFFGEKDFYHPGDNYSINFFDNNQDIRLWMSLISNCDYFLGVDSLGQHIARAFNKPGTVIMGSTFDQNVSYAKHFNIYRNKFSPNYSPIRLSNIDCDFANNLNTNAMKFNEEDVDKIVSLIKNDTKR